MDPLNNQNNINNSVNNSMRPSMNIPGSNGNMANSTAQMAAPHRSHKLLYWLLAVFFLVCMGAIAYFKFCLERQLEEDAAVVPYQPVMQQQAQTNTTGTDASDIQNATSAGASIDAFLEESSTVPDGTDFNDSMTDLNQ